MSAMSMKDRIDLATKGFSRKRKRYSDEDDDDE